MALAQPLPAPRRLRRQALTASSLWRVPDAVQSDFDEYYAVGEIVNLMWTGGYNDSYSDLWITPYNYTLPFAQLLTRDVDLTQDGGFTWTVTVPTDQITAASGGFRLVFTPSTDDVTAPDFDPNADELPSPAFFVTDDSTASSTSSPYGATASATDTASPDAGSMMLSVGALVGIVIATVCILIGLSAFACLLGRKVLRDRRRKRDAAAMAGRPQLALQTQFKPASMGSGSPMQENQYLVANNGHSAVSSSGSYYKPHEVDGRDRFELHKYGQTVPVELDTSTVRRPELGPYEAS